MQLFCKPSVIQSRHFPHVSAVVFTLLSFTVLGVGFPMLLLAQSVQQGAPVGGQQGPGMPPPPGSQPGMQPGQQGPNMQGQQGGFQPPQGMGGQQGPQIDKGIQVDQGIRGVDKGIRVDQGIRGPNGQQGGRQGFGGGQQGSHMQGPQGFGGSNDQQDFGSDQGMNNDGQGGDQGMSDKQQQQQDARQKQMEKQQLDQMKRGMRGAEQGLNQFDKQITKLTKQGIVIPADCAENLSKVKTIIAAVKSAQSFEDVQSAGIEDMQDSMQALNDCRQQLEVLARWPQTLKQVNSEIKKLDSALKRDSSIVTKLSKQGIDLSQEYSAFETAVTQLKTVRDDADSKIKSGDSEGAFSDLEDGFFGSMQDVWEKDRIIQTMSNLGRFNSDFKRGIADAERTIKTLKRQKVDTSSLEDILAQSKTKGEEVKSA